MHILRFCTQVKKHEKREALIDKLKDCAPGEKTLVFLEMKKHCDFLATFLCQSDVRYYIIFTCIPLIE